MRFSKASCFLILVVLLFISCKTNNSKPLLLQNIHRKWMLVEYKNFSKEEMMRFEANMDLTKNLSSPNQFSAKMGCNNILFAAKLDDAKINVSNVGSTMMYCDGKMELEQSFTKDLPKMNRYKIEGHFLTLTDGKTTMRFVASDWD